MDAIPHIGPQKSFPNHQVELIDAQASVILYTATTDANGRFRFDVPVPGNRPLRLELLDCSGCLHSNPDIATTGIQPTSRSQHVIFFPGCPVDQAVCNYADVDFYLRQPIGPVQLDSADPAQAPADMIVRTQNPQIASLPTAPHVTLKGANLHGLVKFYLSPATTSTDPDTWVLYPAQVAGYSADETQVTLTVPLLPKLTQVNKGNNQKVTSLARKWRWVAQDTWQRFGAQRWTVLGDFRLTPPAYPLLSGFGFKNDDQSGSLKEFLSVYGDNAYICIGAFGACITHVPDPFYWVTWFPVYLGIINNSGGSCVGMSATSLLLYHGDLQPEQFDSNVSFPVGFTQHGPADYDHDNPLQLLTGPPKPANLWAEIRMNHGVQTSSEFIHTLLAETLGDLTIHGDPNARYKDLQGGISNYVISIVPSLGRGHAVVGYDIGSDRVHVYDNNDPRNTNRYIDFDPDGNSYSFPRTDGETWRGHGIFTIPLDIWRHGRTAPISLDGLFNIVLGAADGHYTTDNGGEWGWRADGAFVNTMPSAVAIPPLGPAITDTHTVPLFIPRAMHAPTVTINAHGGKYTYHAAEDNTILQLDVFDSPAGDTDKVAVSDRDNVLSSFRFTPQKKTAKLVPKVGVTPGDRQRLLLRWGGLAVNGGGSVAFQALTKDRGAVYTNDSGAATKPFLVVDNVDGAAKAHGTRVFGPFDVPNGAVQRVTVADWPQSTQLKVELDRNGDGTVDQTTTVSGQDCASDDADGDSLPDKCEQIAGSKSQQSTSDIFLPTIVR